MTGRPLALGFVPLVDAAPVVVAREMGFAAGEGLDLALTRARSWSQLRDLLAFGGVDGAHMLSPMPVAMALGLGGVGVPLSAVSVLSVNGNTVGVSRRLAARMRAAGHDRAFDDARAAGSALVAASGGRLRFGVPFPFSMHAELVNYWLSALDFPVGQGLDIRTVPPPRMAEALVEDEIDAFCVGEPWGSVAVEMGAGELVLPGAAIWAFAPEKVLAVRSAWAEEESDDLHRLLRAVWRAGRWLSEPDNRTTAAALLSRPDYLNVPVEVVDRALSGRLIVSPRGESRDTPRFLEFHAGAATFPWRSQAGWIGRQLAARTSGDPAAAVARASRVFRSDLYRRALAGLQTDMPRASAKREGAAAQSPSVASESGRLVLPRDRFFDDAVFDMDRET